MADGGFLTEGSAGDGGVAHDGDIGLYFLEPAHPVPTTMSISNWRDQAYNVIGSILFNNPHRTVSFMVPDEEGGLVDRSVRPAPVRRLAETPVPEARNCLRTIQFVHHVWIPPRGRHVQELHTHPDAEELIVITSGDGIVEMEGRRQRVREGDVIYVAPGASHELRNESDDLLGAFFVNVPVGDGLRRLLERDDRHQARGSEGK